MEKEQTREALWLDRIRGSLIGGAAGDALGYPVEFMSREQIHGRYGTDGVRAYILDPASGKAIISDDTQMTMFTVCGILAGQSQKCPDPVVCVYHAYLDWLSTQVGKVKDHPRVCWILERKELHALRAPGNTCLSSLTSGEMGSVEAPLNHSKGCGGVMRAAPLALARCRGPEDDLQALAREGAAIAAITHGHPMGYIPAAFLTHLINRAAFAPVGSASLRDLTEQALGAVWALYGKDSCFPGFGELIGRAVLCAENDRPDADNIRDLGEGWVGDEAAAIAVYCALRYESDFSGALAAAVDHSGDSDSTGAVTGNILGAWLGYERIEDKWKKDLELADVLLELAEDLWRGCPPEGQTDPAWERKYMRPSGL